MVSIDKFKLSSVVWYSDKNPTGFTKWMNDFGSLVASTEHGAVLETFLDEKLGREKHLATTVPSYISTDDDFAAPPPDPPGEAEAEAAAAQEQEAEFEIAELFDDIGSAALDDEELEIQKEPEEEEDNEAKNSTDSKSE